MAEAAPGASPSPSISRRLRPGQMLDRLRLQPEHRTGRRQDQPVHADRFLAGDRKPEEFPAAAILDPVAMIVRHHAEHRIARQQPVAAALVEQIAGAGHRMLQHGEGRLAARAAIPGIAGIGANLIAGAGRHGVQPVPRARQRNGLHHRRVARQTVEHGITHRSTNSLFSAPAQRLILAANGCRG